MHIDKSITNGCDEMSRVYSDMFSYLQEVIQDDAKLKELNSLDYSALGMYIGKFVEQEINSSVVQIMRAFCGIEMPNYYCIRYPRFVPPVITDRQEISLNSKKDIDDKFSLRTISLGDAYKALEVLKEEDKSGFLQNIAG